MPDRYTKVLTVANYYMARKEKEEAAKMVKWLKKNERAYCKPAASPAEVKFPAIYKIPGPIIYL